MCCHFFRIHPASWHLSTARIKGGKSRSRRQCKKSMMVQSFCTLSIPVQPAWFMGTEFPDSRTALHCI